MLLHRRRQQTQLQHQLPNTWRSFLHVAPRRFIMVFISLSAFLSVFCLGVFVSSSYGASSSTYRTLTNTKFKNIATSTLELIIEDAEGIMVERVPDTPSHSFVQTFIKSKFSGKWNIETDTFESTTPLGKKSFTNIIVSHTGCQDCDFIVLAAHYDSKYFTEFNFVAATDSAVPCALLIDIARSLEAFIDTSKQKLGIKLVFFDGEEAFEKWTDTDSLYGARHLAEQWEKTIDENGDTLISKINAFVLLDLLGAAKPNFYKFSATSSQLYDHIADVEQRLQKKSLISIGSVFSKREISEQVQDDHIPFLKRGVKVLHLIPIPFPPTWHTHLDDRASIDLPTIDALSKILKVFVAERLQL